MTFFKSKENLIGGIILLVIVIALCQQFYEEDREEKLLKNNATTYAFLKKIYQGAPKSPPSGLFAYKVNNKWYEFDQTGNYRDFKIGDTVLIEYSIEDHSVARVKDKYYMKKYWYLKTQD